MQVSVVSLSSVKKNIDFRYEPEFWLLKYLHEEKQLLQIETIRLSTCLSFTNGEAFDSNEFNLNSEVYIAKIGDVTQKRGYESWETVSKKHLQELGAKYLQHNDILMTLTGDPPDVGKVQLIFNPPKEKLSWNQRVALLRFKEQTYIKYPEFLFVVISSKYCRNHIERWAKGIRQRNVGNPAVLNMRIPVLSKMQYLLSQIAKQSFQLLEKSNNKYQQAQTILLSELGLTDWQSSFVGNNHGCSLPGCSLPGCSLPGRSLRTPKSVNWFIKNYSDAKQAARIDAEYFQPKYEEIINAIKSYSGGWDTLGNLVEVKDKKFNPKGKQQYKYIELANISDNGEITGCMMEEGQDLPTRARRKVTTGDVIVSSIEGSLSSIALIEKGYDQALCSTGFHIIKSNYINSETLLVLLKSMVGHLQLKKGCSGTILTAINENEFGNVVLPKVIESIQTQIQQKVTESFNLRNQSRHLLECAKRAVEIAIEQDEQTAINWLEHEKKPLIRRT